MKILQASFILCGLINNSTSVSIDFDVLDFVRERLKDLKDHSISKVHLIHTNMDHEYIEPEVFAGKSDSKSPDLKIESSDLVINLSNEGKLN